MTDPVQIINALSAPTVKLLDMVGNAIGTMYEPRHKRKMADATAYEISVIGDAMRNAADMPVVYNQDGVAINSEDFSRLMQRAGTRLVLQETMKQHNIESVVDNAYEILEKEESCSTEPVEQGWANRFFDSVADVSDEDLQKIWGEILASEIKRPKSFSLRTLETVRNLSKEEAEAFQKLIPLIFSYKDILFVSSENEILLKNGSSFSAILTLDECGLVNSSGTLSLNLKVTKNKSEFIFTDEVLIAFNDNSDDEVKVSIGIHTLTKAGRELYSVLSHSTNVEYVKEVAQHIFEDNKKIEKVAVHKLYSLTTTSEGSHFTYKEEPEVFFDRENKTK